MLVIKKACLKLDSHLSKKVALFGSLKALKRIRNGFYFLLKFLLVLKVFNLLSYLFGYVEKNGLIRKTRLIPEFMTL